MTGTPAPLDDEMAEGLRAAFGRHDPLVRPSVLHLLQQKTGSRLDLYLHEHASDPDVPVKIDDETRALRDPSGRYHVLGEIGRGGVGVVYKGRDQDLGRDVAMKVLHAEYGNRAEILERFVEEAQIGGQLQHPGIVPVYELGLHAGERPFFAMKLVKGETLAELLGRRSHPSEDRRRFLGIFEQVCQTVAYAHARRVVHRDLKPHNVMVGSFGEVQVVDWGFAKVLPKREPARGPVAEARAPSVASVISTVRSEGESGSQSVAGSLMGTPAYMPPEQALGDVEHMDQRSDVFGLGAMLCEILTGAPPYLEADGDLVRQAAYAELGGAYGRLARCGAEEAMVALCRRCLSAARRARPESAKYVADAVSAYLSSVEERAQRAQIRAAEARVRARATLLLSVAALLLCVVGVGSYLYLQHQARAQREEAERRLAVAYDEANVRFGEARAAGIADLAVWTRAVDAARQAERLAAGSEVGEAKRSEVRSLLAAVRRDLEAAQDRAASIAKEKKMRERLIEVRVPADGEGLRTDRYLLNEARRRDGAYSAAFREYLDGRDLSSMSVASGAAALDGPLAVELAAAIDHWVWDRRWLERTAGSARSDPSGTARLRGMAAALDPDPWRNRLRAVCRDQGGDRTALLELFAGADLQSLSATSLSLLGSALHQAGARSEAIAVYRVACERFPTDVGAVVALARAHELAEEWREAAEHYRVARALRPAMREVQHQLGVSLGRLGELDAEERIFRELARVEPDNGHWQFHLAHVAERRGSSATAIEAYRRAVQLDPSDLLAEGNLGNLLVERGQTTEAIAVLRRVTELDPAQVLGHDALGRAWLQTGDAAAAAACFRRAIALDSKSAALHTNLGNALFNAGKTEEAIDCYETALELDPSFPLAYYDLGAALYRLGRLAEATAALRRAVELDPADPAAHRQLGRVLAEEGELDFAIESYRRAVELEPSADVYNSLGCVLRSRGRIEEAVASFRRAVELDRRLAIAHSNLGITLDEAGMHADAVASHRLAIELDPAQAESHFNYAVGLGIHGELSAAIESYRRATQLDPAHAGAWFNLGNAFAMQLRHDEAESAFRRARAIWSEQEDSPPGWQDRVAAVLGMLDLARDRTRVLLELARGERDASDASEFVAAAAAVYHRGEYQLSADTYARAFTLFPELRSVHPNRYNAACAAVLAGGGEGDAAELSGDARHALRERARGWLRAEFEAWRDELERDPVAPDVRARVTQCLRDPDLAAVRDEESLADLPPEEAARWRELWRSLADLAGREGRRE